MGERESTRGRWPCSLRGPVNERRVLLVPAAFLEEWMEYFLSAFVLLAGFAWIKTGRDPLLLAARACLFLRAAFVQAGRSLVAGAQHFRARYREALAESQREAQS